MEESLKCNTSRLTVNNLLDQAANVSIAFGKVERPELDCSHSLAGMRFEDTTAFTLAGCAE